MAEEKKEKENTGQAEAPAEEKKPEDNTIKVEEPEKENKENKEKENGEKKTAEAKSSDSAKSEPSDDEKKGFFKKKDDKEKAALKDQVAQLQEKVMRQMAEFDNYRKRTDKEKDQMFSMGEKSVIEKILPIVDNFERGFATVSEEDKKDAFYQGMEKVYQQLTKQLEDLGVKPIEAEGKEFDPNFHNAVMQVESDKYESGMVAQELQKGYLYHDQVLRHSMVSVVK